MKNLILTLLLLAIFASCSKKKEDSSDTPATENQVLMPFKVGNYWEYIDSIFNNGVFSGLDTTRLTITNSKSITFEGKSLEVFYWTWDAASGQVISWFVRNDSDGLCFYGGTNGHEDFIIAKCLTWKYPVNTGDSWETTHIAYNSYPDSVFNIIDTSQTECLSTSTLFRTMSGELKCIFYKDVPNSAKMTETSPDGIFGSAVQDRTLKEILAYYKPGLGFIGYIQKIDGVIRIKKTLSTYKLN